MHQKKIRWLVRNTIAIGLLSLFSDAGHELTTAILPLFLATFSGGAAALGLIEGVSDLAASLLKMAMAHVSDRVGRRKPLMFIGYFVTALTGCFGLVTHWWQLLVIRSIAWIGRGGRGPLVDALLTESVPREARGRAFGFERAMDTLGAVIGPAIALSLIGVLPLRHIFFVAFIPGAVTLAIVLFMLHEVPRAPQPRQSLLTTLLGLPGAFRRYAAVVGVFGLGNFGHTLLVYRAVSMLTPRYGIPQAERIGVALYILHNIVYAASSYPAGWLGDRGDKRQILTAGYALFGLMCVGFIGASVWWEFVLLFCIAGIYIGIVDTLERVLAADLLPGPRRATGFGALATVNAFGDLLSSVIVGALLARQQVVWAFGYGAVLSLAGAAALWLLKLPHLHPARD